LDSPIHPRKSLTALGVCLLLAGCVDSPHTDLKTGTDGTTLTVLNAATHGHDGWRNIPVRGKTEYRYVEQDGRAAIMAVGKKTASGFARRMNIDPKACRIIRWSWRIDRIQTDVNLRQKRTEDVAASIFLTFGDPGFLIAPDPVPSVRYVWTTEHMAVGEMFDSPFLPDVVKTIVVENRRDRLQKWVSFERDMYADYMTAYGNPPGDNLQVVVLFTDNDQSRQPVTAYYGPIEVRCGAR
jgi:hypothetical protein